ncbi:MAG TPA: asparagine synthase-related protein [Longimicrobium sp.]|nr:asparagine synthase-related protein [Longimicrobium sp.]
MSDFLFSTRRRPPGALRDVLAACLGPVSAAIHEWHGGWGSLAVARAAHDAEVVRDDAGRVSVVLGEPLLHEPSSTPRAATAGPPRRALHALLADDGVAWDERVDGPFALLSVDTAGGRGRVVTDLFAWIPLYAAQAGGALLLGSHPDATADAAGARDAVDPVSAAEMVSYWTITHPHTLYQGVMQLPPGSERAFGPGGWEGDARTYWRPVERTGFPSPGDAAEALRVAFVHDVEAAVEPHATAGVLLSGGEDSRAVLGAIPPRVETRGFTFAEADNREVRSARRVARAYGAGHAFGLREHGKDLRDLPVVARMVGSQNHFLDVHSFGMHETLGLQALPIVLGGFSSDALLKADNVLPPAQRQIRRGQPPDPRPYRPQPVPGVREELLAAAHERRERFRLALRELRPESGDEWSRIYPFTMRKYAANHHGNRRLFRAHEPYMSNRVVKLAAEVPQAWKVDRRLFSAAFRPLLARSWYVPHTRNRFPYLPTPLNAALRPVLGAARRARALLTGTLRANQESWPIWEELAALPLMGEHAARYPLRDSAAGALLAESPDELAMAAEQWPALRRFVLLQLAYLTAP